MILCFIEISFTLLMGIAVHAGKLNGPKLYQERAKKALPLLVRQAHAATPVPYSYLAMELGMENPRNLNYVLGSIGETLKSLGAEMGIDIPQIQTLVVNKNTGVPGGGISTFISEEAEFKRMSPAQKRAVVAAVLARVYAFSRWPEVLQKLNLTPCASSLLPPSFKPERRSGFGIGESEDHKRLKDYVASNPSIIHLPAETPKGATEYAIPSGDSLDVFFAYNDEWVAAEVKSAISNREDIVRGLFQCIKYKAVLEAWQVSVGKRRFSSSVLVLEAQFPPDLISLRNALGVPVFENVHPL